MPSPWDDEERYREAALYVDQVYERLLGHLGEHLSRVHGVGSGVRYWRIIVGPWLMFFIHVVYDRYEHLKAACRMAERVETDVMAGGLPTAADTADWLNRAHRSDAYNLQLFSEILRRALPLGHVVRHEMTLPVEARGDVPRRRGFRERLAGWAFATEARIAGAAAARCRVALFDLYIPRGRTWQLTLGTRLRALPFVIPDAGPVPHELDHPRREALSRLPSADDFEQLVVALLPRSLPRLFVEGFAAARKRVLGRAVAPPPLILSANGWYFQEGFKLWAAEATESGSRLAAVQHGGGYGLRAIIPYERHERSVADVFLSWGWADPSDPKLRNLPSLKLSPNISFRSRARRRGGLLFVASSIPRYMHTFHSVPVGNQAEDYFAWQGRFLASLTDSVRADVSFRTVGLSDSYGQAVWPRIARQFPALRRDESHGFRKSLRAARLVIVDNLETTFLESLRENVPTVLFWDPRLWQVRPETEGHFESLRRASVLFDTPEDAAAHAEAVDADPETWWRSESVQRARRSFVDRYALATSDWCGEWVRFLLSEAVTSRLHNGLAKPA